MRKRTNLPLSSTRTTVPLGGSVVVVVAGMVEVVVLVVVDVDVEVVVASTAAGPVSPGSPAAPT